MCVLQTLTVWCERHKRFAVDSSNDVRLRLTHPVMGSFDVVFDADGPTVDVKPWSANTDNASNASRDLIDLCRAAHNFHHNTI